jgi:hypothetical protein
VNSLASEIRALLPRSATSLALQAAIWAVFGILIPLRKGLEFFDPMILTAFACLGAVFAAPVVVRTLPDTSSSAVLARVGAAILYGEFMALGLLGLGIFAVYWSHRGRWYFPPAWGGVSQGALFGLCLTAALALAGCWLTLALTDQAAKFLLRIVLLAALVAFLFQGRALPDAIAPAIAVTFALAALFLVLLRREIRRRAA